MSELNNFAIHQNKLKCAAEGSEGTWTTARIKLLLKERFGREHDFKAGQKKKSVLWNGILRDMRARDPEFPFMPHEIKTKFYNLLTTFKRVKRRKGKTDWKYYELFESVYGTGHFADESQPLCADGRFRNEEFPEVVCDLGNSEEGTRPARPTSQKKNTKRKPKKGSEILEFLRYQEKQEERRHREFLALEQKKVDVEVQKLQALLDMQNLLRQALLNQNVNGTAEFVIKAEI